MTRLRALVALRAVAVALVLQVSLFPHLAWHGIVPNLCLLVVVASALTINAPPRCCSASRPGSRSTWRRRRTTWPAAGRWR